MGGEFRRGWAPLLAAFLGTSLGIAALFFYSLGIFIKPLQAQFGWSRAALSAVPLIAIIGSAAVIPLVGALADRFGPRLIGCLSLAGLSAAFFLLSRTTGAFTLFLALTCLLAVLGAGSSPVVFSRLVTIWFDRSRGLALGIAACGAGAAGIVLPNFLPGFVAAHGWRAGYALLALLPLAAVPLVFLLAREDAPRPARSIAADVPLSGMTLRQAQRTGRFWRMCLAFFLVATASSGFIVHFIPLLTDSGLAPSAAGGIAALVGIAVVAGRLATGAVIDRVFAPYVAAVLFAVAALGCFLLAFYGAALAPLAALMVGFSFGAEVDLVAFLVARYFGLRAIGAVYGFLYACFIAGNGAGPMLTGALHYRSGSYALPLFVGAGALGVAACLTAFFGPYPEPAPAPC